MRKCIIKGGSIRSVENYSGRGRSSEESKRQSTPLLILVVLNFHLDMVITYSFHILQSRLFIVKSSTVLFN